MHIATASACPLIAEKMKQQCQGTCARPGQPAVGPSTPSRRALPPLQVSPPPRNIQPPASTTVQSAKQGADAVAIQIVRQSRSAWCHGYISWLGPRVHCHCVSMSTANGLAEAHLRGLASQLTLTPLPPMLAIPPPPPPTFKMGADAV